MHLIGRRNFVAGLGLGAGATLFSPLCKRIISDALGQTKAEPRFVFLTQGNAWNHQGEGGSSTNPGTMSSIMSAPWRSASDFDLPSMFRDAFTPYKSEVAIWIRLKHFDFQTSPPYHGTRRGILTALRDGGGISIDRYIGKALKTRYGDIHDSAFVGTGSSKESPAWDGAGRPAAMYTTPLKAYTAYFGQTAGMAPQQLKNNLELEKSLLDGMREDIERVKLRMGSSQDVEKFDQALQSLREYEQKLQTFSSSPSLLGGSKPPAPTIDTGAFERPVMRAFADITALVQAYNLTHVSHFSIDGGMTFSEPTPKWKNLAGPDFLSGTGTIHGLLFHRPSAENTEHCRRIHRYVSSEVAYMRKQLGMVKVGDGTMADHTVFSWAVNGGLAHHGGANKQALVLLAGSKTKIKAPNWISGGDRHMGSAYVSLAQAAGISTNSFGAGQGALPNTLKA
jgi:hypothetical protein